MKKSILFATMLLGAQMCWADSFFFCGKQVDGETIESDRIVAGEVKFDNSNRLITVKNATIVNNSTSTVFEYNTNKAQLYEDESFTVRFEGNNTIVCNGHAFHSDNTLIIEGANGYATDKVMVKSEEEVFTVTQGVLVKNITMDATANYYRASTSNEYNNRNWNVISTENCSLTLKGDTDAVSLTSNITCNGTYISLPETFTIDNGMLENNNLSINQLVVLPVTNKSEAIKFADANVKQLCVSNWDTNGDGELSYAEAEAVKSVGYVFARKTNVTSFEELQYFTGLESISEQAFFQSSIKYITIPANVRLIGQSAFRGTKSLKRVTIPCGSKLNRVGSYAFDGSSIQKFTHPLAVERVEPFAFSDCVNLDNIAFGSHMLTYIGSYAFSGCAKLNGSKYFDIPRTVTFIGEEAFKGCTNMSGTVELRKEDEKVTIERNAFNGTSVRLLRVFTKDFKNLNIVNGALGGTRNDFECRVRPSAYVPMREQLKSWPAAEAAMVKMFAYGSKTPFYYDKEVKVDESKTCFAALITVYVISDTRIDMGYVDVEGGMIPAYTPVMIHSHISDPIIDIEEIAPGSAKPVRLVNYLHGVMDETFLEPAANGKTRLLFGAPAGVPSWSMNMSMLSSNPQENRLLPSECYVEIPEQVSSDIKGGYVYYKDSTGGIPLGDKKGDVNGDGVVDISDVNVLIDILLSKDSASKYNGRADVTVDGTVDISDVNAVLNLILGK